MHIVLVTAFFTNSKYDVLTGMPGYVIKIAKCLLKRGHRVEIVTGSNGCRIWDYDGVIIHEAQVLYRIDGPVYKVIYSLIERELSLQKCLREINQDDKIDIIQYAGWSGTGMFHCLNCPSVLRLSTYSIVQYKNSELFGKYCKVFSFFERLSGKKADGVIAPGRNIAESFSKDIKKNVSIIETPYIDDEDTDYLKYDEITFKRYFLFYGTASYDKGFETLSAIIPDILEKYHDVGFVFAGWDVVKDGKSAVGKLVDNANGSVKSRIIYLLLF